MNSHLRILNKSQIDISRWEYLVDSSENGRVFHSFWYLDTFCDFSILLYDDYKGGLILPVKQTFGFKQVYQPPFVQQCGWVGTHPTTDEYAGIRKILLAHASGFHINSTTPIVPGKQRINQIIRTDKDGKYRDKYSKSLKKNIKRNSFYLTVSQSNNTSSTLDLYTKAYGALNPQLSMKNYDQLLELVEEKTTHFRNYTVLYNGTIVAGILLAVHQNRYHYILGAPSDEGRKLNALSVGLDYVLQSISGKNGVFDFEGSSIPTVHNYYKSFGAVDEYFYENILYSKWLKNIIPIYTKFFKS